MKTFLRKLKLSFLAMLCGWVACNIACWLGMLLEVHFEEIRIQDGQKILFLGAATGIVILAAWLVIFLPVDLLISDQSKLRRPWTASIIGFIAGSSVVVIIMLNAFLDAGSFGASVHLASIHPAEQPWHHGHGGGLCQIA